MKKITSCSEIILEKQEVIKMSTLNSETHNTVIKEDSILAIIS